MALDPLDGEAWILLGKPFATNDDLERTMFDDEPAASLESFEGEAKIRQAQLLVEHGRFADAVPLLTRAEEVDPRDGVARFSEQVERVARQRR